MTLPADFAYCKADTRFMQLVGFVLNSEGGYVNHPKDPGGPTKCGIALNYHKDKLKIFSIVDAATMRDLMTPEIARYIYYRWYWKAVACERIASDRLAYTHFDAAVNCGVGTASAALLHLKAKNLLYLQADGKNVDIWWHSFVEYNNGRLKYYLRCKNRASFLEGWAARCTHVTDRALTLPD